MFRHRQRGRGNKIVLVAALVICVGVWWYVYRQISVLPPRQSFPQVSPAVSAFDLSATTIPTSEIRHGGPPKDGIPALTNPKFISSDKADTLQPSDPVIGVVIKDDARAYPLEILDLHEIVNDKVGDTPVAVTYCPLCDSSVVFDRRIDGETRNLGVSGRLYNSNVLMFDRQSEGTESLLSQMMSQGVSGPLANRKMKRLPLEVTTWQSWHERYPDTKVLSPRTGHLKRYNRSVYVNYFASPELMFPATPRDDRLPAKTRVLGVEAEGELRAYSIEQFIAATDDPVRETLGGRQFTLVPDRVARALRVVDAEEGVEWVYSFWFAWYAMNPDTQLWQVE